MSYNDKKLRNLSGLYIRNLLYTDNGSNNSPKNDETGDTKMSSGISEQSERKRRNTIYQDYSSDYSRLIKINQTRMVDTFFTLHYPNKMQSLMYISEIIETNMNPNFNTVSVPHVNSNKLSQIIIKVWCRGEGDWELLIQWDLNLKNLIEIEDLADEDQFKDNTILIKLDNRYYTSKTNLVDQNFRPRRQSGKSIHRNGTTHKLNSYNFDVIRSINNLDKSIRELETSKLEISKSIETLIGNQNNYNYEKYINEIKRLALMNQQLSKNLNKYKHTNDDLMSSILQHKIMINKLTELQLEIKPNVQESFNNKLELVQNNISNFDSNLPIIYKFTKLYLKQFSEVLIETTNISEPNHTLESPHEAGNNNSNLFINGFEFPSSRKEIMKALYHDELRLTNQYDLEVNHPLIILQINSGLSHIVKLILMLIELIDLKVCYKMEFKGNYSIIRDFNNQAYPLYYDNSLSKRDNNNEIVNEEFEKGISLLNKNLLLVLYRVNQLYKNYSYEGLENISSTNENPFLNHIPIDCLDNFLWNLQYLLLYLSAINDSDKQFIKELSLPQDQDITDQLNSLVITQGFDLQLK